MEDLIHQMVLEIRLPPRFTGMKTYYRDDIAVLTVTTQFKFDKYVRPVCIDFNKNFDKDQLSSGNLGTIASWGRSAQFGIEEPWQFLREVSLPYVDVEQCLIKSSDMRNYITADKFCAYYNETARELCQGDTGGGLTFPAQSRGRERYFLRGVASTARGDKQYCVMFTTFTKVSWHEQFINQYYAPQKYKCVLPPYPDHGSYTTNMNNAKPGEAYDFTAINVVCEQGYDRTGPSWVFCYNGLWPEQMPQCVAPCRLPQNLSVNYRCVVSGSATNEVRRCNEFEPPGTIVIPQCLLPQYYTPTTLSNMRCVNGGWDYTPKCTEMCLLFPHFSVDYRCLTPGSGNDTRICNEYEPPGTVVKSKCRLNYHSPADLTDMECVEGKWNHITICSAHCYLAKHASVQYGCFIEDTGRTSYCYEYLPSGTVVSAHCRAPYYYSTSVLPFMKCNDGYWNYIARCSPVCGMEYLNGPKVVLGGQSTKRGEAPWHATIYFIKNITEYEVKCGGSIITNSIILTAAHCFWDDGRSKVLPSSDFFVAAGMLYSNELNNEETVQQSGVKEIHIPDSFQGSATSYFNDIAAVILNTAFEYKTYVRPICIDFDDSKEKKLLQPGTLGKVAGWSLGKRGEKKAGVSVSNVRFILKIAEIPFVNVEECSKNSPRSFYEYITSDKYCARSANDAGPVYMCEGDTGGGWAFPISDNGVKQYYLRGIASRTNGNKSDKCGLYNYTTFTRLLNHEHFIKRVLATEL